MPLEGYNGPGDPVRPIMSHFVTSPNTNAPVAMEAINQTFRTICYCAHPTDANGYRGVGFFFLFFVIFFHFFLSFFFSLSFFLSLHFFSVTGSPCVRNFNVDLSQVSKEIRMEAFPRVIGT